MTSNHSSSFKMSSATIFLILALSSIGAASKGALRPRQTIPDQYDYYFGDQTRADTFTDYFTDSNGQAPGIDYTTGGAYITGSDYYTLSTDGNFVATETGLDYFSSAVETGAALSGAASSNIFETGMAIASRTSGGSRSTVTGSRGGGNSNSANDDNDNGSNGGNNNERGNKNAAPGTVNAQVALTSVGLVTLIGTMLML